MGILRDTITEDGKGSFGRIYALPFLLAALLTLSTAAILILFFHIHVEGILDIAYALATIGFGLYTGSKTIGVFQTKALAKLGPVADACEKIEAKVEAAAATKDAATKKAAAAATVVEAEDAA